MQGTFEVESLLKFLSVPSLVLWSTVSQFCQNFDIRPQTIIQTDTCTHHTTLYTHYTHVHAHAHAHTTQTRILHTHAITPLTRTHTCILHTPHIHTCIRTYVHTYIHTYIHAYVHTYIHAYILHTHTLTHMHTPHICTLSTCKHLHTKSVQLQFTAKSTIPQRSKTEEDTVKCELTTSW